MTLQDAEWILQQLQLNTYQFSEETIMKAKQLIENAPYINYECINCDVEYTSRKGSNEEKEQLCHKCYLRMK